MSKQLTRFAIFATAWTLPYLALLGFLLSRRDVDVAAVGSVVIAFTAVLTSMERHFRGRDDQRAVRYGLDLRYSLVSCVASSLGAALWALKVRDAWLFIGVELALVGVVIAIGYAMDRQRIKGSSKEELFQ